MLMSDPALEIVLTVGFRMHLEIWIFRLPAQIWTEGKIRIYLTEI